FPFVSLSAIACSTPFSRTLSAPPSRKLGDCESRATLDESSEYGAELKTVKTDWLLRGIAAGALLLKPYGRCAHGFLLEQSSIRLAFAGRLVGDHRTDIDGAVPVARGRNRQHEGSAIGERERAIAR